MKKNEGRRSDGPDPPRAQTDSLQHLPSGLQQGVRPFRRCPYRGQNRVPTTSTGVEVPALDRGVDTDPCAGVPLVGKGGNPTGRGRVEGAEDPVPSCSGEVVDRSGCDTRHPHRVAGRIGQDLDVAAVPAMFARVPEVVAGIGTLPAPGRGDQGAVEADVFPPGFDPVGEDVVQVRGMGGDHVDTFVEIAVGGGLRDPRVAGECCDVGTVPEPAQHHHRLDVDGRGPLPRPVVGSLAVRGQDAGDEGQGVLGHVERGTIGDHVGSCFGIASWSKRSLPGGIPRPHLTPRCPALHGRCQTHPGEKTSLSQVVDYSKTGRSVRGRCISKKYGYEIQFTTAS